MSRPIKFRAWQRIKSLHRPIGMYEVADLVFYGKTSHGGGEAFFFGEGDVSVSSEYFEDLVLMQFTGLHDKHGVDIYEGDVVRWTNENLFGDDTHYVKPVEWSGQMIFPANLERTEVIGNIYEHPELLKAAS